jgi:PAS domain S-box-containing protein
VTPNDDCAQQDPDALHRQVNPLQDRATSLEGEVQRELSDFFDNVVFGLQRLAPDGTIQWANRAQLSMLGFDQDEAEGPGRYVGRNIAEFHVNQHVIAEILERLARNQVVKEHEARLRCRDGSVRSVLIDANARFEDGRILYCRCTTRDITERKRMERELREQNEELMRAVRFSETFVGILGHDLRNPLSAITTAASLLARRADSERVAKPAGRILNSGRRMARMIDQLLDFTRMRLGRGLPLERCELDLADICRLALEEVESGKEKVRIEAVGDVRGWWDGDRLAQLVSNLLGNALAHGSPDQPVSVRVDGAQATRVSLEVHNGGFIPPELRAVLFEPLKDQTERKREGSSGLGLGLYISQQIVLAHAGTIEVHSSPDQGTSVVVSLPRRAHTADVAFESSLQDQTACTGD